MNILRLDLAARFCFVRSQQLAGDVRTVEQSPADVSIHKAALIQKAVLYGV